MAAKAIKMKTLRSGLSNGVAMRTAAALQDADTNAPQRITVKQTGVNKYSVLIGGRNASLWITGRLPSKADHRRYKEVWGE